MQHQKQNTQRILRMLEYSTFGAHNLFSEESSIGITGIILISNEIATHHERHS
jgi:hypothetical protein